VPEPPKKLRELCSGVVPPLVPNVTMVAFRTSPKPPELLSLIDEILEALHSQFGGLFEPNAVDFMHATLVGTEAFRVDGVLHNVNFAANYGERRAMDLDGFSRYVSQVRLDFRVRFGGFKEACTCSAKEMRSWKCVDESGFHSCGRSAPEGTFYAFRNGPVVLTGWPVSVTNGFDQYPRSLYEFRRGAEEFGILDKYHYCGNHERSFWKDDDCYITLGRLGDVPQDDLDRMVAAVRGTLGAPRPPAYVDLTIDDMSIVKYHDVKLEQCSRIIPVRDLTSNALESMYDDVGW
jgi:hypothetical protein